MRAEQVCPKLLKRRQERPCFAEAHRKGPGGFSRPRGRSVCLAVPGSEEVRPRACPQRPPCSLSTSPAPGEATGEPLATSLCPQHNLFSLSGLHPRALATLPPALWLTPVSDPVSQGSAPGGPSVQLPSRPSSPLPPPSYPHAAQSPRPAWPRLVPNPSPDPHQGHGVKSEPWDLVGPDGRFI